VLKLDTEVRGDHGSTGQDRDIFQHRLTSVAEARRLDGGYFEAATQLVHNKGRECLAFDIFGNDEEWLSGLAHPPQEREQFGEGRKFFFTDQDIRVFHFDLHLVGVGNEVRRDVAAVELHTFDYLEFGLERLRLFDGDNPLVADFLHGVGNKAADLGVAVGRDRTNLCDLLV